VCSLSTLQAFAQDLSFFRARVATQPHERRVSVWNLSPMHRTSDRLLQEIPRRARGSAFCAAIRQNLRQNKEVEMVRVYMASLFLTRGRGPPCRARL
jgi:hypothetical protein